MDYYAQVSHKEQLLLQALKDLSPPDLAPSVHSTPTKFRNKAKFAVTGSVSNPIIGLTGLENLDQGRELLECPLHLDEINKVIPLLKKFITETNLLPYNIEERKGELKGIIVYFSEKSQSGYLRFVVRSKESLDRFKKHLPLLTQSGIWKSVSVNIQPIPHAVLEGETEIWVTENTSIPNRLGEYEFSLSPKGFVQTNQEVAEKLYAEAALWVKDLQIDKMLELFSGQGSFSFFASEYVKEALGIEINPDAVESANAFATKTATSHLKFISSDASKMKELSMKFNADLILINPPRRGLGHTVHLLNEARPQHIIYSSCDYESLAKDLSLLNGYTIKKVKLFDMFPQTKHFETLVLLNKN